MKLTNKKAFTLVEMLIVIVIIGILAAALIPNFIGMQAKARDTARRAAVGNIAIGLESYASTNNGYYPGDVNDSTTLMNKYLSGQVNVNIQEGAVGLAHNNNNNNPKGCKVDAATTAYAYYPANPISAGNKPSKAPSYAITVAMEIQKNGNASDCEGNTTENSTVPSSGRGNAKSLFTKVAGIRK